MGKTADHTLLDRFQTTVAAFQAGHEITANTVSVRLFNDSRMLGRIKRSRNPNDISRALYDRSMAMMSADWPAGTDWPEGIDRPRP